jgi:hypothetical protein
VVRPLAQAVALVRVVPCANLHSGTSKEVQFLIKCLSFLKKGERPIKIFYNKKIEIFKRILQPLDS